MVEGGSVQKVEIDKAETLGFWFSCRGFTQKSDRFLEEWEHPSFVVL